MFQEMEGMLQKAVAGQLDQQQVAQATSQHVNSMDPNELTQHVQTAADNAQQNGNTGLAAQLYGLVQQYESNPSGLKDEVINLVSNNPQILQQFAPEFAQNVLQRI